MKKLFFVLALLPALGAAQSNTVQVSDSNTVFLRPVCKFGLQFLVAVKDHRNANSASSGVELIQVFERSTQHSTPTTSTPQPMPCKDSQ